MSKSRKRTAPEKFNLFHRMMARYLPKLEVWLEDGAWRNGPPEAAPKGNGRGRRRSAAEVAAEMAARMAAEEEASRNERGGW